MTAVRAFSVILPAPPPLHAHTVNDPRRGRTLSERARKWKRDAAWDIRLHPGKPKPPVKHCAIAIRLNVNYRSDISNRIKLAHDVLQDAFIIRDDRYVEFEITLRSAVTWAGNQLSENAMQLSAAELPPREFTTENVLDMFRKVSD